MNLGTAILITTHLLTFALFLQGLEQFLISRKPEFFRVWTFVNLRTDLEAGLPLPSKLIGLIFSDRSFGALAILQIAVAAFGFFFPSAGVLSILLCTHLFFCVRFRGTFNGGSDMMVFVILTGLLISWLSHDVEVKKLGLIYIAIHTIYSYFKAGLAKLRSADWRGGTALSGFLARSLLTDTRKLSSALAAKPRLGRGLCWSVIAFEMLSILMPFSSRLTSFYFIAAVLFHFVIYLSFGLNRFFWMWMSAWPAILYSVSLIK